MLHEIAPPLPATEAPGRSGDRVNPLRSNEKTRRPLDLSEVIG
jgi:hypothetical protein